MSSSTPVFWPPRLLLVLQHHMQSVENTENPAIPPMDNDEKTICVFYESYRRTIADRLAEKGFDSDLAEYCICFVCDILDEACKHRLLLPRERRAIGSMFRQKMRKNVAAPRSKGTVEQSTRKIPKIESDQAKSDRKMFASLLSLEYLLRLFFTLPPVLEHYDKLGASVMPEYAKIPLWEFVNESLSLLNGASDAFYPTSSYIPLKRYIRKRGRNNQGAVPSRHPSLSEDEKLNMKEVRSDEVPYATSSERSVFEATPACMLSLFTTASGKPIKISEAALQKAKVKYAIAEDEDDIEAIAHEGQTGETRLERNAAAAEGIPSNVDPNQSLTRPSMAAATVRDNSPQKITSQNQQTQSPTHNAGSFRGGEDWARRETTAGSSFFEASISKDGGGDVSKLSEKQLGFLFESAACERVVESDLRYTNKTVGIFDNQDSVASNAAVEEGTGKVIEGMLSTAVVPTSARLGKGFFPPRTISSSFNLSQLKVSKSQRNSANGEKIVPLFFPYPRYTSDPSTEFPSIESIVTEKFHFTWDNCGKALEKLFGLSKIDKKDSILPVELQHWRRLLLNLGAIERHCTSEWCHQMVISSMLQVREICCSVKPNVRSSLFTPTSTVLCLCLRYNREVVEGERPPLCKMTEGDVSAAALVVLCLVGICSERATPHTRIVLMSDGFYHLKVALDISLSNLLRQGALSVGQKIAVCGARCRLRSPCLPTSCLDQVVFDYNYNCVRPVRDETALGFCLAEPSPLSVGMVHPQGGLVPALQGTVSRVLPPFFVEQSFAAAIDRIEKHPGFASRTPTCANVLKIVRNITAQCEHQTRLSLENAETVVNGPTETKVSCVSSLLIECQGEEALIQHWKVVPVGQITINIDDYYSELPTEGSTVVIYGLNPSRSQNAAAPFPNAKLFYISRVFHYKLCKSPNPTRRQRVTYSSLQGDEGLQMGGVVDVVGVFAGMQKTAQGTFFLLLLSDGKYAILHVPLPSIARCIVINLRSQQGSPVLVTNATFVCYEDAQCGSDCARLFANEYTVLTQQSTGAMDAFPRLTKVFNLSEPKYASRCAEILRCASEVPGPTDVMHVSENAKRLNPVLSLEHESARCAVEVAPVDGSNAPMPWRTNQHRVPYYLREDRVNSVLKICPNRGVVLSKQDIDNVKSSCPNSSLYSLRQGYSKTNYFHHLYGNVIEIVLVSTRSRELNNGLSDARCVRQIIFCESDNGAPAQEDIFGSTMITMQKLEQYPTVCKIKWRYGSASDVGEAEIQDATVLDSLLEPCISAHALITNSADEYNVEDSLERTELLNRWRTSPGFWWKLFTHSYVSDALERSRNQVSNQKEHAVWLPSEWFVAKKMIKDALNGVLFKFTLQGNVIERVFYVTNNCFVSKMF